MMKKLTCMILIAVLSLSLLSFSACTPEKTAAAESPKIKVLTTVYPVYDWITQVGQKKIEADYIEKTGADLHSFQPTAEDIANIKSCDLFVYVGGESDEWIEDLLEENKDINALNLMDKLDSKLKEDEIELKADGTITATESDDEYDEHIWLSLKNAKKLIKVISDALGKADPAHVSYYEENSELYRNTLTALDDEYAVFMSNVPEATRMLIFGDRFPFKYLCRDYNISYAAAFNGCSAETEASFETLVALAKKAETSGVHTIMTIEGSDNRIAQGIIDNMIADGKDEEERSRIKNTTYILALDSMQSGITTNYYATMVLNLETLKKALT